MTCPSSESPLVPLLHKKGRVCLPSHPGTASSED